MMDAFFEPLIETITYMTSAQVGKTEILNNIVGYFVDQDPSPMLVIQPTLEMSMSWSKDRLAPMLRDTPCLHGRVKDARSKDSNNTILHKTFPGGHITIAGANSPVSLSARPVRVLLMDEVDRYPPSAGAEGDPVKLAVKRTKNFFNRKIMMASTPKITGTSRIEIAWNESDQRHYFVPCTKCGHFQKLVFGKSSKFFGISSGRLVFDEHNLSWVYYECENCKGQLDEADKHKMVRSGRWEISKPEIEGHAGFHVSELYSPWSTWRTVVKEFLDAKQRREMLQAVVNTTFGETWDEEESYTIDDATLLSRREEYTNVPSKVLLITVGADTQDDRIELAIKGWGVGFESWLIGYHVVYGSPSNKDTWEKVDEILTQEFILEDGSKQHASCTFIDSAGHFSQDVYKFTRARQGRRVFSIVGRGGLGRPLIGKSGRGNVQRALVIPVGVDDAKTLIYRRLSLTEKGPGFMHFPMSVDDNYFRMLTAEKQVLVRSKGFTTKVWRPKTDGRRNEALDCEVYAMAAMAFLNPNFDRLKSRRAAAMPVKQDATQPEGAAPNEEQPVAAPRRKRLIIRSMI